MPYISAPLDPDATAAVAAAAANIAVHSLFKPEERPFHVTLVGTLHMYSDDQVARALSSLGQPLTTIPDGRFTRWELTKRSLRLCVESQSLERLALLLHGHLRQGRVWQPQHVTVGSIEGIPMAHRGEFLAAVEAAFPIVEGSVFKVHHLEFENDNEDRPNPPMVRLHGCVAADGPSRVADTNLPRIHRRPNGSSMGRMPMDVEPQRPKSQIQKQPTGGLKPAARAPSQPATPKLPKRKAKNKSSLRVVNVDQHP